MVVLVYKFVYIGDNFYKNFMYNEVKIKIMYCVNYLCDVLKLTVKAIKTVVL